MLDPDQRLLFTDALRPPPGYRFEDAVATTYSLDLETLLTIPLHLALFSADEPLEDLLRDGVTLLEALRRTTDRITVFAQSGRILAPQMPHVLYGLLEPTVVEAQAPSEDGSFHPKLWLIRFEQPGTERTRLRLLVLSRNVTGDRCWDLALTLEGEPDESPVEGNGPLHELLRRLPMLAVRSQPTGEGSRAADIRSLAELALRTPWEPPPGFDTIRFHSLGLDGSKKWLPEPNGRLAVISPFLAESALQALAETSKQPKALVSRSDELAKISPEVLGRFERVMMLAEEAEVEDGEEPDEPRDTQLPNRGLHAKAYIIKKGRDTRVYLGSANASNPALLRGANVELMAELIGKRSQVGAVEDLLDADGLGAILVDYIADDEPDETPPEVEAARLALEAARRSLRTANLHIHFSEADGQWRSTLHTHRPLALHGIATAQAWLVTRKQESAQDIMVLVDGRGVEIPEAPLSLLTSFVAFELTAADADETIRFVLRITPENLPVEERDAAIVRDIIRNREGFLRYVMLLLAEAGDDGGGFGTGTLPWGRFNGRKRPEDELPVFEHLTRTFCRSPERLESVQRLMEEVGRADDGEVVPPEFLDLWEVFRAAMPQPEERTP